LIFGFICSAMPSVLSVSVKLTPAAAPILREIRRYRAKLYDVMVSGIDPAVLDAMMIGLRQMKNNLSTTRRIAEESAQGASPHV
jgi:cell division FtsZ-interacting protein ZapD